MLKDKRFKPPDLNILKVITLLIKMKIRESKRFIVGWGREGKRIAFFIKHSELPETIGNPIVCNSEDLPKKMVELADRIDKSRGKI